METSNRLEWVDIAKALSIMLVVMMYTTYGVGEATGVPNAMHWIVAFAKPLRMPEFFLISGLFLSYGIARSWRHFVDKRVVHYMYFYVLWSIILYMFKVALFDGNLTGAIQNILAIGAWPYSVLWFIYALALFSLAIKVLHSLRVPHWAALAGAAVLQMLTIETSSYFLNDLAEYFVYFYAGYAFAPLVLRFVQSIIAKPLLGLAYLAVWAVVDAFLVFTGPFAILTNDVHMGLAATPGVLLPLATAGALAVCVTAGLLTHTPIAKAMGYLGSRSLVVYLSFLIPMAASRELLLRTGIISNDTAISVIVLVIAVLSPLLIEAVIMKTGFGKFFFIRPKWAHIYPAADKKSAKDSAIHVAAE